MTRTQAYRAALLIIEDILDRRDLKHVFRKIDEDAHDEILTAWADIIEKVANEDKRGT